MKNTLPKWIRLVLACLLCITLVWALVLIIGN